MKIILCLTTILYTCNAGIHSGYGGNSVQEIEIEPQQLQQVHQLQLVDQGYNNAPREPFEIINIQEVGNGAGYGGGHSGAQNGLQTQNGIHSHNSETQIIKIIHEHSANSGSPSGHVFGGQSQPQIIKIIEEQSSGSNYGNNGDSFVPHQIVKVIGDHQSYDGGHGNSALEPYFGGHGSPSQSEPQIIIADPPSIPFRPSKNMSSKPSNPFTSLGSIIPQLLRFLFGGGGGSGNRGSQQASSPSLGGHLPINTPNAGQLTDAYGYGGTTRITRGGKLLNSFYNSGQVIESGTLKISQAKKGGK